MSESMYKSSENTSGFRMCQTLKKHCKTAVKTLFLRCWWYRNSWKIKEKAMPKSSSTNVGNNGVKKMKNQLQMGPEIINKSMKNHIKNQCVNIFVKKLEKWRPRWAQLAPKGQPCPGFGGPRVPVRGKEFLPETPGSRFAIANHHHTNNHQAIK